MDLSFGLALSMHLLDGDWNEVHPYARLEAPITEEVSYGAGAFLNSEGRVSAFLGLSGGHGRLWWEAGLATGYSGADAVPFGRAGVEITDQFRAFVAPAYNVDTKQAGFVVGTEIILIKF